MKNNFFVDFVRKHFFQNCNIYALRASHKPRDLFEGEGVQSSTTRWQKTAGKFRKTGQIGGLGVENNRQIGHVVYGSPLTSFVPTDLIALLTHFDQILLKMAKNAIFKKVI